MIDLITFFTNFYQDPKNWLLCAILIGMIKQRNCLNRIEGILDGHIRSVR